MKFTINQLSKSCGISTETLRYYRTQGLLQPSKDNQNGYYYYCQEDALQAMMLKRYRSMGMGVKLIQSTLEDQKFESQNSYLISREKEIEDSIELLQNELDHVKQINYFLNMTIEKQGTAELVSWDQDVYSLYLFDTDNTDEELIKAWSNAMPYTYPTVSLSKDELNDDTKTTPYNVKSGLCCIERNVKMLQLPINKPIVKTPKGLSIRMFIKTNNPYKLTPEDIKPMRDYVKEHNFSFIHDSSGWIIASNNANEPNYYIILRVRVG